MRNVSTLEITETLRLTSNRARSMFKVLALTFFWLSSSFIPPLLACFSSCFPVIIVCLTEPANKRLFMLTALDQNLLNDEYIYIFADLLDSGYSECYLLIMGWLPWERREQVLYLAALETLPVWSYEYSISKQASCSVAFTNESSSK